jgi:prepilin-type N-terminal cleavage/methylation domain-containing protein
MTAHESTACKPQRAAGLMPAVRPHRRDQPGGSLLNHARSCHHRRGYTLLEMLLATVVSVLLLGALYKAMDTQIRHAQIGRDVIGESTLAHSLLARISSDIKKCVIQVAPTASAPLPPSTKDGSSPAGGAPSAAGGSSPTAAASGTPSSGAADSSSSTSSSAPKRDTIQFQLGVQGTASTLSLYISRLPSELNRPRAEALSDLRLVSYWLAGDPSRPLGLARREFLRVTSDEANSQPMPGSSGDEGAWIAPEVQSLTFRYFDGTNWYDTWDGTETGWDYVTPVGPPLLIEITLGIVVASGDNRYGGIPRMKVYRQSVSVPMADGVAH